LKGKTFDDMETTEHSTIEYLLVIPETQLSEVLLAQERAVEQVLCTDGAYLEGNLPFL
jgi:hypothetical protein